MTANKKSKTEGRLFAIGDIHGCPDELAAILKSIAPVAGDTVVFVGDYVDRGPSARAVIDLALDLERGNAECVFLKGNHEDMMMSYLGLPGNYGESFLFNGGIATLDSYGVREEDLDSAFERLPDAHLGFMTRLATSYLRPPYLFVHAGIMPTRQLEEQQTEDMLWIRQEFIFNPHKIDATVVFGHTPMRGVMIDLPYKLGIDTGLVYGGKLTCVEFTEGVLYQVQRGHKSVKTRSIPLR
ncbi:MAG TPA: metallophosphoesterase family protein [Candidatus Binatus sp.]|uniref:metallophosphoesterase family protein n=1 Tax=Candidatus Binatus sp. TaxID=2811406 RepID=UPI002F412C51